MFSYVYSSGRLKRYLYPAILALGLAADASAMLFDTVAGTATPFSWAGGGIVAALLALALFARCEWRQGISIGGGYLLLLLLAVGWWQALYAPLPAGLASTTLLSFSLWLPAVYALLLLNYRPAVALPQVLLALAGFTALTLPHALATLGGAGPFDGLRFLLTLVLVHLALSLLFCYAVLSRHQQQEGRARLSTLAYTDPLTGIANRRALSIEAVRALNLSRREGWPLALLYLDLDNFKSVNDRFGHKAGDEVLQQVSARLQGCLRGADLLSRIGGDEFVLLLHDADVGEAIKICGRIILELESPVTFGSHSVRPKASIGGAIFPKDGADLETLLEKADKSMYAAKAKKTGFTFYSDVSSTTSGVLA